MKSKPLPLIRASKLTDPLKHSCHHLPLSRLPPERTSATPGRTPRRMRSLRQKMSGREDVCGGVRLRKIPRPPEQAPKNSAKIIVINGTTHAIGFVSTIIDVGDECKSPVNTETPYLARLVTNWARRKDFVASENPAGVVRPVIDSFSSQKITLPPLPQLPFR